MRKQILMDEVGRICHIKQLKIKFDWVQIFRLESGFEEKDLDRRKRDLFRILHPDKSAKFAKYVGEERLKDAYDFVDVAYSDAKKWFDQKKRGFLPPWERDPFDSLRSSGAFFNQNPHPTPFWMSAPVSSRTSTTPPRSQTPPTSRSTPTPPRKAVPPRQPDSFRPR
eukprot:Skav211073  [mRNA]  locus=scaffold314:294808:295308:- [translate_table: standard]